MGTIMNRQCRVPGCSAQTTRYGAYCSTHKSRARRHGAPDQRAISKAELKPYLRAVRARIERNRESPVWAGCEANWRATVENARGILAAFQRGQPGFRFERLAAVEVVKLAEHVEAREVMETVFALYLLLDSDPRRFTSDGAFRVQLVRRVRGLANVNAGEWRDGATGRVKRAYHETPPKAAQCLAGWIIRALAGVGLGLAKLERQQREEKQRRADEMGRAMMELR